MATATAVPDDWAGVWREAARVLGLGLHLVEPQTMWQRMAPVARLHGRVGDVAVVCRSVVRLDQRSYVNPFPLSGTQAIVEAVQLPAGFSLEVTRGYLYPIQRAVYQDIRVGELAFDDRFIVSGGPEDLVRLWLTPAARDAMYLADEWRYRAGNGRVLAELPRLADDPRTLVEAVRACAALASRAGELARQAEGLAGKLGGRLLGEAWRRRPGVVLTVEAGGTVVTVEQLHGKLRSGWREPAALYTRAWCARSLGVDDRFVAVAPGEDAPIKLRAPELPLGFAGWLARAEDATRLRRRMGPAIGRLIDAARPLAVVGDDDIVVWARGLVDDEVRVRAMAELAAALAIEPLTGGLGPYR